MINDKRIMDAIMIGYQDKDFRSSQIPTPIGVSKDEVISWLKSLRPQPKQEWSEEDEQLLGFIYDLLADSLWNSRYAMSRDECLDRLTSLRQRLQPRPSWKPSEHQMTILKAVKDYVGKGSGYWGEALGSLIEDLEKL